MITIRQILTSLTLVALLAIVGCACPPDNGLRHEAEAAVIEQRLHDIFDAAEKKDLPRLDSYHLYGPKFTKFAPEHPGRQDSALARKGEHDGVSAVRELSMKAEDLKIDLFGNAAVATFLLNYTFKAGSETVRKTAYSTLVFVKHSGEWKITHEHFSAPASPPPAKTP